MKRLKYFNVDPLAAVKSKSWDYKLDEMDFFFFSKCLEKKHFWLTLADVRLTSSATLYRINAPTWTFTSDYRFSGASIGSFATVYITKHGVRSADCLLQGKITEIFIRAFWLRNAAITTTQTDNVLLLAP